MILPLLLAVALIAEPPAGGPEALLREARSLRMAGRWYEAADLYRRFLRDYPKDGRAPEARFWLANTLEQDQRWDEAAATYTDFLTLHPDQRLFGREAKLNRLRCWGIRQGQNREAIPGLLAALSDEVQEVRIAAALQLAKRGEKRAEPALQSGLNTPRYAEACRLALESMGLKPQASQPSQSRFLVIRIRERGKEDEVTIRIAAGLARAVGSYLSDEQIAQARKKGVDIDDLMDQIQGSPKGTVLFSVEDKTSRVSVTVE